MSSTVAAAPRTWSISVAWGESGGIGRTRRARADFRDDTVLGPDRPHSASLRTHLSIGPVDRDRKMSTLSADDARFAFSYIDAVAQTGEVARIPSNLKAYAPDDVKAGAVMVQIRQNEGRRIVSETLLGFKVDEAPDGVRDLLKATRELSWPAPATLPDRGRSAVSA